MLYAFITLTAISLFLLLFSFLKETKVHSLEKQLEHLSLTVLQDQYQTTKRLDSLEEALFSDEDDDNAIRSANAKLLSPNQQPLHKEDMKRLLSMQGTHHYE